MADPRPEWLTALACQPGSDAMPLPRAEGCNNQGVVLHRLLPGLPDRPELVIEKRSRHRSEARLHRYLGRWQQRHPGAGLLPRVYGVLPLDEGASGEGWRLFQAFVPHAVEEPASPQEAGRTLAELACDFHRTMAAVMAQARAAPPPGIGLLFERQRRRVAPGMDPEQIGALASRLAGVLALQRPVMAHNDLHWSNIRTTSPDAGGRLHLIDLGRAGWNLPGAEFHGALRRSLLGGGAPGWRYAIDHYAALSGTDPVALRLGCLWFALVHTAGLWRQAAPLGSGRVLARETRLMGRLQSRITALLEAVQEPLPPAP